MRCTVCKRAIAAGPDAQKMIVEYDQGDGTTKVFGYMMPDGPLSAATGQLLRAYHHKHFHSLRKREARGGAVTGRVVTGGPSAYDLESGLDTDVYSERLARLTAVAVDIGLPVGDPRVQEAFWAQEHGGPYPHTHHLRLETYQLLAHLSYAHGLLLHPGINGTTPQAAHDELHAQAALAEAQRQRANDPGHIEPPERDWREQTVVDI